MTRRLAIFLLAAAASSAAETPAPAAAGDEIAAAKKDYAEIEAAGTSLEQQKLTIPKQKLGLDLRERNDRITPPAWMTRKGTPDRAENPTKKSENWLVDAMIEEEPLSGRDGRGTKGAKDWPDSASRGERIGTADLPAKRADAANELERAKRDESDPVSTNNGAAAAVNPLTDFMAEWLTERDYALLQPRENEATLSSGFPGTAVRDGKNVFSGVPMRPGNPGDAIVRLGDPAAAFSPQENPYLADMMPLASPAMPPVGQVTAPPRTIVPSPAAPPNASAPQGAQAVPKINPAIEAVRKARDDEKYFKPLKRF